MYIKGELYQQAIVEIRAALAEDPDRIDLQILLANIYFITNRAAEAIDLAHTILRKLPNAYQANWILATLLVDGKHEAEAQKYRRIVNSLNPYAAHISSTYPTIEQVPEQAVVIDRLDWKPGQDTSASGGQPAWAASLGLKLSESETEKENELPEWMKASGWETSASDNAEPETLDETEDTPLPYNETVEPKLEKAEIPDWLKDIAPPKEEGLDEFEEEEDVLPWLEKILPSTPEKVTEEKTSIKSQMDDEIEIPLTLAAEDEIELEAALSEEIPDWLITSAETNSKDRPKNELPDWLSGGEKDGEARPASGVPDWLSESMEEDEIEAEASSEIPDWLAAAKKETSIDMETNAELATDIPDWLTESDEDEEIEVELAAEIPDWLAAPDELAGMVAESGAEAEVTPIGGLGSEAEPADEIPDWLAESVEIEETEAEPADKIPDWLAAPDELAGMVAESSAEGRSYTHWRIGF